MEELLDKMNNNSGTKCPKTFFRIFKGLTRLTSVAPKVVKKIDAEFESMSVDEAMAEIVKKLYCQYESPVKHNVIKSCARP